MGNPRQKALAAINASANTAYFRVWSAYVSSGSIHGSKIAWFTLSKMDGGINPILCVVWREELGRNERIADEMTTVKQKGVNLERCALLWFCIYSSSELQLCLLYCVFL